MIRLCVSVYVSVLGTVRLHETSHGMHRDTAKTTMSCVLITTVVALLNLIICYGLGNDSVESHKPLCIIIMQGSFFSLLKLVRSYNLTS